MNISTLNLSCTGILELYNKDKEKVLFGAIWYSALAQRQNLNRFPALI